jgi:hypothetical protein
LSRTLGRRPAIVSKLEERGLCGASGFALLASHLQQVAPSYARAIDFKELGKGH